MKTFARTLLILLLGFKLNAQEIPTLETFTLKNGLKVYFLKYGKIKAMHVKLIINSGKKNETPGQQGYNSIASNLVLQGNKKYSEEQQNDLAFAIGAELKSESDKDRTTISGNFLSKDASLVFDLMSAAVLQPLFDKDKLAQYISYMSDYNKPSKMNITQMTQVYSNLSLYGLDNPLGRTIYREQLNLISSEKLKEFHAFNYTPKNTKVLVCGNFESVEVKALIEKYFGAWESTYGEVNGVSLEMPSIKKRDIYFANRLAATQCALQWNFIAPSEKSKDVLAFEIANMIFNNVLFKEIREKGGKTYGISSTHQTSQFSNLMAVFCSVRSNEALNTINLFDKTLENFSKAGFTQEDFDIELIRFKTNLLRMEYPEEIANYFDPVEYDFNTRKKILEDVNKLKLEDIQKVVKKYYTPGVYVLVLAGDESILATQLSGIKGLKRYSPVDLKPGN